MKRAVVVLALVLGVFGFQKQAHATHFRFGHISWVKTGPRTVQLTVTQAYRWTYPSTIQVPFQFGNFTPTLILTNAIQPALNSQTTSTFNNGGLITTQTTKVVEVNVAEDYMVLKSTITHTYPGTQNVWRVGWNQGDRISTLLNGHDTPYIVMADVDLTKSASAVSSVPPTLVVPKATGLNYALPISHPTGEAVTCSLPTISSSINEVGYLHHPGPPGSLPSAYTSPYVNPASLFIGVSPSCVLKWNTASLPDGFYAVQVRLTSASGTSPIDFVIKLVSGSNRAPICTGISGTQALISGAPFSATFTGTDPDNDQLRVTHVGLPTGATLSPASGTVGASPLNATFAWTPTLAAVGTAHAVTITYTDTFSGLQGNCAFAMTVTPPDTDGDGVIDPDDNCPALANGDQADFDGDGIGDACDPDIDDDGILNGGDNCAYVPNPDQSDLDGDHQGDLCDGDKDGDLILDGDDNCPIVPNADQFNLDSDAEGDVCDDDDDNDGVTDPADNCPVLANSDQEDLDGDGLGDACDDDRDGDGVENATDNCVSLANADQANFDGDAQGDACDGDDDNDGVGDGPDNCPLAANTDQANLDGDLEGDVCDLDIDGDGEPNASDNCPINANPDQADLDGSGGGDVCDADDDNDGVADTADNCARIANASQADLDHDGQGDACDSDLDGDGVANVTDNCVSQANTDQADEDHDGSGDLCDDDLDGDGVLNATDNCVRVPNASQADLDGDGQGDACDSDLDGDGRVNTSDNCPAVANPSQADLDTDGIGDACDGDVDGDGVANATDNCLTTPNADQADLDSDGQGNACDADVDGDGVGNTTDNCVIIANASQSDLDGDGQGDACDGDTDGDGVLNPADQCPLVPALADADGNGCLDTAALLCGVVQSASLPQGITTSLCAKSNAAAAAAPSTALNILSAFINEVEAQSGKKIPVAIANLLIAFATNAKANL